MVTFRVKPSTYKFKSHRKKIEGSETKKNPTPPKLSQTTMRVKSESNFICKNSSVIAQHMVQANT
jgi:hypothetical protein